MLLPAAEILQKREADNREASRDRKRAVIGLWIAASGLGLNFLWNVFGEFLKRVSGLP
jgi:hypothetical protein